MPPRHSTRPCPRSQRAATAPSHNQSRDRTTTKARLDAFQIGQGHDQRHRQEEQEEQEEPRLERAAAQGHLGEGRLRDYHLLPSVRGDLLARLGRTAQARAEFARAAGLTRNARERELLAARVRELGRA